VLTTALPVVVELSWEDLLIDSETQRLQEYKLRDAKLVATGHDELVGVDRIHELHHSVKGFPRSSQVKQDGTHCLQALVSHGCLSHVGFGSWLTALEWGNAQVLPVWPGITGTDFKSPINFEDVLKQELVSRNQFKAMCGLGCHLASCGSWVMWVLSKLEIRSVAWRHEPVFCLQRPVVR
jgi:hypothetical protein